MEQLSGQVAVVTGGASGIGLAMARRFAAEGMRVVLGDIEQEALDHAVGSFPTGAEVMGVATDVSNFASVEALRDDAVDGFGAVHLVCNNAGVGSGGLSWECSLDDWEWVLGVDLWGVIYGVKAFAPLLVEQGEGHIVNTASMAGLTSPPFMGPYNVAKHGVVTLSETMYSELALAAPGVGISVVCPGWVKTRIDESGRNRPGGPAEAFGGDVQSAMSNFIATGIAPEEVASAVLDAVLTRRFYVLTHPEWKPMIEARVRRILDDEPPNPAFLPTD